jgi:hypothetical protein
MEVLNPSRAQFPKGWEDAVNLADATPAARQALMTLGLALADLRGHRQWHERSLELLSAGTWNVWERMKATDRNAVRQLLPDIVAYGVGQPNPVRSTAVCSSLNAWPDSILLPSARTTST